MTVEFFREVKIDKNSIYISLKPEIESYLDGYQLEGSITGDFHEIDALQFNSEEGWIFKPSFIKKDTDIEVLGSDSEKDISFTITSYTEDDCSITVGFPSLSIMNAVKVCYNKNIAKIPPQINRLYDGKESEQLVEFINEISEVVSYNVYINVVEQLADISPKFRHYLRQNIEKQLIGMLTGRWQNDEYSIESYSDIEDRINDFENLKPIQKLSKNIGVKDIIKNALSETAKSGSISDIVVLARTLKVYKYHEDILRQYQIDSILAVQLIDGDYSEAWELITQCFAPENKDEGDDYQSIKKEALSTDDNNKKRVLWKNSLPVSSGNQDIHISVANYLYWTARTKSYEIETNILLYKSACKGFENEGITHMHQHAKFNWNYQTGIKYSNNDEYKQASEALLQAYETGRAVNDQFEHEIPGWIRAYKKWSSNLSQHYRFNGDYQEGIKTIESALEQLSEPEADVPDENNSDIVTELRAKKRILEMEQYLVNGDYELALETAVNIIKLNSEIDEGNQDWAITKRKEIKAIIDETNGDLDAASSLHEDIGKSGSISEPRQDWHSHRADICKAKSLALDNNYEKAKNRLLKIKERTDKLKREANDLAVVLEAINNYEDNVQRDFQDSLNRLSDNPTSESRTPPMRLEYNYEDPLSVIHSAQWLQTYDADPEVLSMSVEVALRASLIPLHGGESAAKDVGLDDVNIREQWLMELPAPIAQRITQIRLDTSVPQTDYSGLGSRLYTLLEIYLAIFGEYYGKLKWGSEWRRKLSDRNKTSDMALGDLTNIFNKCENEIESNEEVATLIEGTNTEPPVEKLRNDIGHGKTDDVHGKEYEKFQDRVFSIFEESLEDVPVIGKMIETRGKGDFQVELLQLKWWQTQRRIFIQTSAELQENTFYYLPHQPITSSSDNSKIDIDASEIHEVETDRITEKL